VIVVTSPDNFSLDTFHGVQVFFFFVFSPDSAAVSYFFSTMYVCSFSKVCLSKRQFIADITHSGTGYVSTCNARGSAGSCA